MVLIPPDGMITGSMNKQNNKNPVQQLRRLLESGRYPGQGRLPPERELSVELGVSRSALRKGLSVLEAENLIWRHVGRGTFVGPKPAVKQESQIGISEGTNPAEIMEVRFVLEPKIAAMAALRATPADMEAMKTALIKSEDATDAAAFEILDGALHQMVANSCGNSLLISFFNAINSLREDKIWGRLKEASFSGSRHRLYCRQHRELVEAINDRDAAAAEKIMRAHLETVQRNLLGSI